MPRRDVRHLPRAGASLEPLRAIAPRMLYMGSSKPLKQTMDTMTDVR